MAIESSKLPADVTRLTVLTYPDPRLRQRCRPIEPPNEDIERVVRRMFDLMRQEQGVGLAAPQIGLDWRLFVCNPSGEPADEQVYINPRLINLEGSEESEEGCLSIPNVRVQVRRATHATIVAVDMHGKPIERSADDLLARIWQHEADHLDGRLILDHMSQTDQVATRRALRQLEAEFRRRTAPAR